MGSSSLGINQSRDGGGSRSLGMPVEAREARRAVAVQEYEASRCQRSTGHHSIAHMDIGLVKCLTQRFII